VNDFLEHAKTLARLAVRSSEVDETLGSIPPTEEQQNTALARACYETFVQPTVRPDLTANPPWDELPQAMRDSLISTVVLKILPHARQFETLLARLSFDMMKKRAAYLANLLKQPPLADHLARAHWATQSDELQFAMSDSVERLERVLKRAATRPLGDEPVTPP
jgi:hypothetical protein